MRFIKLIIVLPLLALLLIFSAVNNDFVTLKIWPSNIEIITSLSVVIVFLFAFGYFIGWLFTWISYSSIRSSLRAHKKQNKKLSKEQEKLTKEVKDLHSDIEEMKESNPQIEKMSWKNKLKSIFSKK